MGWSGGVVGSYPLLSQAPTPVEVELGCDNKPNWVSIFDGKLTKHLSQASSASLAGSELATAQPSLSLL